MYLVLRRVVANMYQGFLVVLCIFAVVQSGEGSYSRPCNKYDKACITRVADGYYGKAIRGDPLKKIQILDPLFQSYTEGKFLIINYRLYNTTIVGFKNCHVVDTDLNLDNNTMNFKLHCPHLTMNGLYDISGKLIVIPIEGKGDLRLECDDYHIYVETGIKIVKADDGKKYLQYKSFKVNADLRGRLTVDATGLFHGKHKDLADAALKFINTNWKPVSKELQGPVFNINVKNIIKNINKFMRMDPLDNLLDY